MSFWMREFAGWVLLVLGLAVLGLSCWMFANRLLLQTGPTVFVGFVIFRGGIHLLKVAVAARICLQAQERLRPERPPAARAPRPAPPPARRA